MKAKIFLSMLLLLGAVATTWAADRVKGDGNLTTKKISIGDFNEIKVDGVIDFYYEQSDEPSNIEVTVDQNLHPYVNIEIKDRVLSVGFKGVKVDHFTKFIVRTNSKWLAQARVSSNANFVVSNALHGDETIIRANANSLVQLKGKVTVGKLYLNVAGSANMVVDNVEADMVECDIDGDGTIGIKHGTAKEGAYNIVGKGDINAFGLAIPQINCKLTRSGLAEVHATEKLKATIIGGGNIRYKGTPAIEQRIIGKGTIDAVK